MILGAECRSLIWESRGDIGKAIAHREKEIALIRRLHELSRQTPHEALALEDCGYDDLSDRLDLLATLHHDNGNLDWAIAILQESRQLCETHGLKLDGEELLREYLEKKKRDKPGGSDRSRRQKEDGRSPEGSKRTRVLCREPLYRDFERWVADRLSLCECNPFLRRGCFPPTFHPALKAVEQVASPISEASM